MKCLKELFIRVLEQLTYAEKQSQLSSVHGEAG